MKSVGSPHHCSRSEENALLTSQTLLSFPQDVPLPPDDEIPSWSETEVRSYFSSGGCERPELRDIGLPGGGRDIAFGCDRCHPENAPQVNGKTSDLFLTPTNYRAAAFKHGIPFRKNGLFPIKDALLTALAKDKTTTPFCKNVVAFESSGDINQMRFEVAESWANGDGAAMAGLDLRCFYRGKTSTNQFGTLIAAFRLGSGAAIGKEMYTSAHGGSVETVLDETTAELVKCARAPNCATTELTAKILKPVSLHKTFKVECEIVSVTDFRARTKATITDPETGAVYATCDATLADIGAILRTKRK